jgi:hypothetical protein
MNQNADQEVIELIAREMAKNHGYNLPDGDLTESESPKVFLFVSDAEIALKVIAIYLAENDLQFKQLMK